MRIIAGSARGRRIETLHGYETRPTADRVKESVFSILQSRLAGAHVLDLFAGSGALGLEALSRGAAHAVFADNSLDCVRLIRKNADKLGFAARCTVIHGGFERALGRLQAESKRFDIAFLDPPYRMGILPKALELLFTKKLMLQGAVVACEHDTDTVLEDNVRMGYIVCDRRRYGSTGYTFIMAQNGD
ncbi:MAG: 16S rRNA (guanine(966)-N(2))-methyltransferase RsmD [Bacillota bacterium]